MKSKEVSRYIEAMFPIHRLRTYFIKNDKGNKTTIIGNCDNKASRYSAGISVGALEDVKKLEEKRREKEFDKVIAIVSQNYFRFHFNKDSWRGLVLHPIWKNQDPVWLGGSWNVTLVREGTEDGGVLSHELGHLLGQGKEFYQGSR